MRRILKLAAAMVFAGGLASSAQATQAPADYITSLYLSGASNYAFRIFMRNPSTLPSSCGGGFAYVNTSADNYQAYVSVLTTAYSTGKQVVVTYTLANGYCVINEFNVLG